MHSSSIIVLSAASLVSAGGQGAWPESNPTVPEYTPAAVVAGSWETPTIPSLPTLETYIPPLPTLETSQPPLYTSLPPLPTVPSHSSAPLSAPLEIPSSVVVVPQSVPTSLESAPQSIPTSVPAPPPAPPSVPAPPKAPAPIQNISSIAPPFTVPNNHSTILSSGTIGSTALPPRTAANHTSHPQQRQPLKLVHHRQTLRRV